MFHQIIIVKTASFKKVKEKSLKTRKELTDYVEETLSCIVCMVGFQISTDYLSQLMLEDYDLNLHHH